VCVIVIAMYNTFILIALVGVAAILAGAAYWMRNNESFSQPTAATTAAVQYQGHGIPLTAPPVTSPHDNSLFMLANNRCDPSCCPSMYSCDKGCVCLTQEQKALMSQDPSLLKCT
jgi:hypothetical protein